MDQEIPRFESQISARPVEEIREQRFRFLCRLDKNKSDGNRGGQRVVKTNSESWAFFCSVLNDRARRRILRISRETTNKKKKREREREREKFAENFANSLNGNSSIEERRKKENVHNEKSTSSTHSSFLDREILSMGRAFYQWKRATMNYYCTLGDRGSEIFFSALMRNH